VRQRKQWAIAVAGACGIVLGFVPIGAVIADDPPSDGLGPAPRVAVARPVVDLGRVLVGEAAIGTFVVENRGDVGLRILEAASSCDCTVIDYDAEIAPGATGSIRAELLTNGLEGSITKGILVRTNDPARGSLVLTLKAHVVARVSVLPQRAVFLRRRSGEASVGRLLIRAGKEANGELVVSDLRTSVDWLVAEVRRLEAPRPRGGGLPDAHAGDWLLEVRFRDDEVRYGNVREVLRFLTGLADQPEVEVSVESSFAAPVNLSTAKLVLGRGEGGASGTFFASIRKGLDPSALRVEADPPGLEVHAEPTTERMFKIDVRWVGERLEGASVRLGDGESWVRLPVELAAP